MEIGQKLPEVLGLDQDGKEIRTSDFKGKKLVLYIYPKDSTPDVPTRPAIFATTMSVFSQKAMLSWG